MIIRRCRECGEEFRPGVAMCSDCGGTLEDYDPEAAAAAPPGASDAGDALAGLKLATVASQIDAAAAERAGRRLREAAIPFRLDVAYGRTFTLKVAPAQAAEASALLQKAHVIPRFDAEGPAVAEVGGPCPACQAPVPPGSTECPDCGLSLGGPEADTCPKCGAELDTPGEPCARCAPEE